MSTDYKSALSVITNRIITSYNYCNEFGHLLIKLMKSITSVFSILLLTISVLLNSCVSKENKNEDFWKWFSENQNKLYTFENNQDAIFDELHGKLIAIDSNLVFEFGPVHKDSTREFTISADGLTESFPAVIQLVNAAPKFRKWKIKAFRQRNSVEDLEIVYDDTLKVAYDDIYFRYSKDSDKIGIELNIRNYKDSPNLDNAVYILLDGLIGEYDMETKISWIERKKLEETKIDSLYQIVELRKIVDDLKHNK